MRQAMQDRLLVGCVREHGDDGAPAHVRRMLANLDQHALLAAAVLHRVAGCVAARLSGLPELDPAVAVELAAERRRIVATYLRTTSDLRLVDAVLAGAVPWLVLKGPALAAHYGRTDVRSFVDLDVLVPPTHFPRAVDLLEGAGFKPMDANWTLLAETVSGELHLRTPHGGVLDLHWDLHNDSRTRRSFAVRTTSLLERARTVVLGGTAVRTLDPMDTLVHTAMHAARSGGDRLVWMKDLEQLVLHRDYEWDELAERSLEHRAGLPVAVMLQRSRTTLQVPGLPNRALELIGGPGPWRILGSAVDRVSPVVRAGADGSACRLYARSLRGDSQQTLSELGRRSLARARRQGRPGDQQYLWDPADPRSRLHPSGGPEVKAAFLRDVTRS